MTLKCRKTAQKPTKNEKSAVKMDFSQISRNLIRIYPAFAKILSKIKFKLS